MHSVNRLKSWKGPSRVAIPTLAALVLLGGLARAQQATFSVENAARTRVEQLEREVQGLKAMLNTQAGAPEHPVAPASPGESNPTSPSSEEIKKLVDQRVKEIEEEKKIKEEEKQEEEKAKAACGTVVGDDLKLQASWDWGGIRLRSADEAFSIHIGGRLMTDEVWFTQSPALKLSTTPPAGSGLPNVTGTGPGIGVLQDGFFVRRVRFVADGQIYQTIEWKTECDFENYNSISFDESYVGARDLPFIETVRFGQTHVPFGLEAYTSSRFLPMLERSPVFDAFYQEFAPGIFTDTTFFDQRVTTQHMFHRIDNFSQFNGASFGNGKYAYSGRVTALPIYEDDGRCLLHLGVAYQWRKASTLADFNGGTTLSSTPSPSVTLNQDVVRFRTRQGIRDNVGLQGNPARIVDTGNIIADHVGAVNGELLWYWGPLWVQSEAVLAQVDNAVFPASSAATQRGDLYYHGSYVQVGYFLTGDNRGYDKRMGKYDRVRPLENFFLVRDENGHTQYGLGAWEIVYRFGYVNLNDHLVDGGRYGEHTVGLNWYWNSNIKFQLNYLYGQRVEPAGANDGMVQGVGLRAALEF